MPTRTRTVLFTDLANYTRSVGRTDRQGLRDLIQSHAGSVPPVLERYGGVVVKNLGDSFMALFPAATDAVRAGLDLVEKFTDGDTFRMRVAMATGDVEEIDGDAFGDTVNLASRILGKTPAGEVWFSLGTHVCMNQAEIAWEPCGRFQLKGIATEQPVYRAVPRSRAWLPEPITSAARKGHLVRIQRGDPVPALPPNPVILLEGFEPSSAALENVVNRLPVVDPAALWLVADLLAPGDRVEWEGSGRGLVIGRPEAVEKSLELTRRAITQSSGSDTIIIDVSQQSVVELVMAGLALPAVPYSDVVAGYTYDLLRDGRWVNRSDVAVARVDCSPSGVTLHARAMGISVDGRQLQPGDSVQLDDGVTVQTPSGPVRFRALQHRAYLGLLLAETLASLGIAPGQAAEIGREPQHPGLALPDRRGQENIRWCIGARAARARDSGFTLDRALAGRHQSAVTMGPGGIRLSSLHETCATFLLDGGTLEQVPVSVPRTVVPGDLIVTGTSVILLREPSG